MLFAGRAGQMQRAECPTEGGDQTHRREKLPSDDGQAGNPASEGRDRRREENHSVAHGQNQETSDTSCQYIQSMLNCVQLYVADLVSLC